MWEITYFNEKVLKEIKSLPMNLLARFVALSERMRYEGSDLGMPHTRAIGNGLFEIRLKAKEGIARIFYCTEMNNEIVILHSFIKKTQQIPKKELEITYKRLREIKYG